MQRHNQSGTETWSSWNMIKSSGIISASWSHYPTDPRYCCRQTLSRVTPPGVKSSSAAKCISLNLFRVLSTNISSVHGQRFSRSADKSSRLVSLAVPLLRSACCQAAQAEIGVGLRIVSVSRIPSWAPQVWISGELATSLLSARAHRSAKRNLLGNLAKLVMDRHATAFTLAAIIC